MASVSHRCNRLQHVVFQPDATPETRYSASHSVQIELTIAVDLLIVHRDILIGRVTGSHIEFSNETLRFDLPLLEDPVQAYESLGAMLMRLRISPASFTFDDIVNNIIRQGLSIGNQASNRGNIVLPLRAEIWGMVDQQVNNESVFIRRAMEESALASDSGMVPADESSVKKMLTRVRLEDGDQCAEGGESNNKAKAGEDCVICMEEIGSDACQMPCSHTFHATCIQQWLKQSHYCPICRFEMPTSETFRT